MSSNSKEPMFKSVGQALSVAFSVAASPAPIVGSTARALESMSEKRYGAAVVLESERTINREGLKPHEFRAQCMRVVDVVGAKLLVHERDVIYCRFGHQLYHATGIRGLQEHYGSLCNTQSEPAVHAIIMGIYVRGKTMQQFGESPRDYNKRRKQRRDDWSVRTIEKEYGVSKSVLHRDQVVLRKLFYGIEEQAQGKLEEIYLRMALIADPNDVEQ